MAIDLTGGLPEERDFVFAEKPGPEVRDAVNVWFEEENGAFAMRLGIEAVAEDWDRHEVWIDVAYPDGRVLSSRDRFDSHSPIGAGGKPTVLGTGPLRFECIEPFKHWRVTLAETPLRDLTTAQLNADSYPDPVPTALTSIEMDFRPVVPPLISGTLTAASRDLMSGEQGSFISPRFEQLCRAEGRLTVDGQTRPFKGQVLRIKRQGVRKFEGFWGHCWMSAVFPSGRAFGVNTFPPREDGQPNFNEGFVFDGDGPLRPARAVEAPWMQTLETGGEPLRLVLETDDGERTTIEGVTFVNCRSPGSSVLPASFPIVQQSHARYTWDGESATGMIERSTLREKMKL